MRRLLIVLSALLVVSALVAGCGADLGTNGRTVSNEYTGGSIPPGKGPVRVAGYVVDATNERAPVAGSSVTVASTGAPGTVLSTTTDATGLFFVDEVQHGIVTITASGPGTYQPISCVVNATTASVVTCSIATYPAAAVPILPTGLDLGDTITGMAETIADGETIYPGRLVAGGLYANYLTFVCASNRVVVNRDGSFTAVGEGTFELQGQFLARKPSKVARVAE